MNRVINTACGAEESSFKDLFFILADHPEFKIAFAHRAAEDIHEFAFHYCSSLISMICDISGPVEISVMGLPMSSSACFKKASAFLVSLL